MALKTVYVAPYNPAEVGLWETVNVASGPDLFANQFLPIIQATSPAPNHEYSTVMQAPSSVPGLRTVYAVTTIAPPAPSFAAAWGFTKSAFYNASFQSISSVIPAPPNSTWYTQPFFGSEGAQPGDIVVANGEATISAASAASNYRSRLHTCGNNTAAFTASATGSTLTVTAIAAAYVGQYPIAPGQTLQTAGTGSALVSPPTILPFGTNGTTGQGGTGTYALSGPASFTSQFCIAYAYTGTLFKPGGYFEATWGFNSADLPHQTNAGWIAFWMQDILGIISQNVNSSYSAAYGPFCEIDFFEALNTAASPWQSNIHSWTNTNGGGFGTNTGNGGDILSATLGNPNYNNQNRYGMLWVPTTLNGGNGFLWPYFNGAAVGASPMFSYTSGSTGALAGLYVGESSIGFNLMIEGGYLMPATFSEVAVWQSP